MVMGAVYVKASQTLCYKQRLTRTSAFVFAILRAASLSLKTSDTTCQSISTKRYNAEVDDLTNISNPRRLHSHWNMDDVSFSPRSPIP